MCEEITFEDKRQGRVSEEDFQNTKNVINEVVAKADRNTSLLFMTAEGEAVVVVNYSKPVDLMKMFLSLFNGNADTIAAAKNAELLLSKKGINGAMEVIAMAEHLNRAVHGKDNASDETIRNKYKEIIEGLKKDGYPESQK